MLRVPEIKLSLAQNERQLPEILSRTLGIRTDEIREWSIYKKSIDARKKDMISFVYSVDFQVDNEDKMLKRLSKKGVIKAESISFKYTPTAEKDSIRPVIVGTGPSGIFAGMVLAELGYNPILLERGKRVDDRVRDVEKFWETGILNTESNVQFGEGGAGTFSDGKLTTLIKDPRCRKVLEYFVEAGAPEDILYVNKPHLGTDILRRVVPNLRERIISLGGEVRFQAKVTDLIIRDGAVAGVVINGADELETDKVVLALGHSARDTFEMLYHSGIGIQQKAFSIGVRIEHPQEMISRSQYGELYTHPRLGAADYKLSGHFDNGRSAYTFCMCPGGTVVAAASEEGMTVTNGMSERARDRVNANAALLVNVTPEDFGSDHPLAGVEFQRCWERSAYEASGGSYKAPAQLVGDFLVDRTSKAFEGIEPSYKPGVVMTDLRKCLPPYVTETMKMAIIEFDKRLKGFARPDAVMTGVETRSSSPVRITRDEELQTNIKGLYPAGEGAGYAGGIISAAVDGIRVAEKIGNWKGGK
jgi:hypothetical protein